MKCKQIPAKKEGAAVFLKNRTVCQDRLTGWQEEMVLASPAIHCLFIVELRFRGRFLRKASRNKTE
jgi:uncharacterized membrane protein